MFNYVLQNKHLFCNQTPESRYFFCFRISLCQEHAHTNKEGQKMSGIVRINVTVFRYKMRFSYFENILDPEIDRS